MNLITEVDSSNFSMHFLIGKADCRHMQFMKRGKKLPMFPMSFGLALVVL